MKWNNPEMLWGLLALVPLLAITGWLFRRRGILLGRMAENGLWSVMLPHYSPRRQRLKNALRVLALAAAILALARPQWGFDLEKVQQRGLSIMVALDTSKSMLAKDIAPNRLQQAKWGIRDLLGELKGDRIGLVAFAGGAFLQCPVTSDYSAFMMMLDDTYAGIIPVGGTDLYEALDTAMESFDEADESGADKVIILISDGEGHTGDPLALLPKLKEQNIRVFTIGVGTQEGKPILTDGGYVKDADGNVINSVLNEGILRKIATETDGFYVRSAPGDFGLETVYKQGLAHLQRSEGEERIEKVWNERFQWFLGLSLVFLLMEAAIRPVKSFRKTGRKIVSAASVLLILLLPSVTQAGETARAYMRQGLKACKAEKYEDAVALFTKASAEFPYVAHFNLGNAHFQAGDFGAATNAYHEALSSPDLSLQAASYYNLGNAILTSVNVTNQLDSTNVVQAIGQTLEAMEMYENALRLAPADLDAKQNLERALERRLDLEFSLGKCLFDQGEALLQEYKAKEAKARYMEARGQFEHLLAEVDADHAESKQFLPKVNERLAMLERAVESAKEDLQIALEQIDDYQYALAAQRLTTESDERKYAFDVEPELKTKYDETIRKNQEVLNIIENLSTLNTVE